MTPKSGKRVTFWMDILGSMRFTLLVLLVAALILFFRGGQPPHWDTPLLHIFGA